MGDGNDGVYDRVEFCYNRQSQRMSKKDQNGSLHEYAFDALGRIIADKVTTVGSGVDDAVRRIETVYEVRGMVETLTSYDATSGGNVVNQVVFQYDQFGLVSKEYQEHEGAKDASTLYVQYNRDTTASGGVYTKGLRATSVRYPNGRLVHTTYGTSGQTDDVLHRVAAVNADNSGSPGAALSEYTYLGAGTIVKEDFPEPDVRLDYDSGTAGEYAGFDRFGRVVNQRWYDYGASANRDQFTYGYDRASNRLYRENTGAAGLDEFYTYDGVNRLATFERGDLNAGKTAISGTAAKEEDWSLDMTGNWTGLVQKTAGSTDLDQGRSHNEVNEITAVTATSGTNWADPVHDRNGNMTTIPKPASLANGLTAKYDAWNRLVEVKDGQTVIGRYQYDGLNRRIKRGLDSDSPASPNGVDTFVHYFYNSSWQTLETRETATESAQPENLQPKLQYVWSERYIDAPILRDENTDTDGLCDDQRIYYLGDANFNVTTLVDTGGDALERYVYSPYGVATIYDATWSNTRSASDYDNVVLYTGREYDPETGLYHYRNRYYGAELGRFVSRDPISYRGGINLYEYVGDNPIGLLDPKGMQSLYPPGHQPSPFPGTPWPDPLYPPAPPPPLGPLTPDEQALFGFCDKLDYSRCPKGCTDALCRQAVDKFIRAVRSTWILNLFGSPLGPNTCKRWANTCKTNVGGLETTNPCVSRSQVCLQRAAGNLGLTNIHATFVVGLCGQYGLEADNGFLGGGDHIILPPGM